MGQQDARPSRTRPHPGVEVATGPLGQGFGNGVGMAIAEAWLAARYNRPGHNIVDHYTYAICGDGDLMEGITQEAASLAGHLRLGKLIYLYDQNHISLAGGTDLSFTEDVASASTPTAGTPAPCRTATIPKTSRAPLKKRRPKTTGPR